MPERHIFLKNKKSKLKKNKKEGNENMIFLLDLVMTFASANERDAQSPLAMMRMWSSKRKGAFTEKEKRKEKKKENKEKRVCVCVCVCVAHTLKITVYIYI